MDEPTWRELTDLLVPWQLRVFESLEPHTPAADLLWVAALHAECNLEFYPVDHEGDSRAITGRGGNNDTHHQEVGASAKPTKATGPVRCKPWCTIGNGHADEAFIEDQGCWSDRHTIVATMERPYIGEDSSLLPGFRVFARQEIGQPLPYAFVEALAPGRKSEVVQLALSATEAKQFRDALTDVLAIIEPEG